MPAHLASKPLHTERKAVLLFEHYLILQSGLRIDGDKFGTIKFPNYLFNSLPPHAGG
jgi:hypothetical protein